MSVGHALILASIKVDGRRQTGAHSRWCKQPSSTNSRHFQTAFIGHDPSFTPEPILEFQPFQRKGILVSRMFYLLLPVCGDQFHVKARSVQTRPKLALKSLTVTFKEAHHLNRSIGRCTSELLTYLGSGVAARLRQVRKTVN